MKEVVEGNKALKEEMSQEVEVSMELKEEDLISLLLRSVSISVKKGAKHYLEEAKLTHAKTTQEQDLLASLHQERAKTEQLMKVFENHSFSQESQEMRRNRQKEGEDFEARVQEMREAGREQEQKWEAERKTVQVEMEALTQQIAQLKKDSEKKQHEIVRRG